MIFSQQSDLDAQTLPNDLIDRLKIKQNEPTEVKLKKLTILQGVAIKSNNEASLREIIYLTKNPTKKVKLLAIKSLGECGRVLA